MLPALERERQISPRPNQTDTDPEQLCEHLFHWPAQHRRPALDFQAFGRSADFSPLQRRNVSNTRIPQQPPQNTPRLLRLLHLHFPFPQIAQWHFNSQSSQCILTALTPSVSSSSTTLGKNQF